MAVWLKPLESELRSPASMLKKKKKKIWWQTLFIKVIMGIWRQQIPGAQWVASLAYLVTSRVVINLGSTKVDIWGVTDILGCPLASMFMCTLMHANTTGASSHTYMDILTIIIKWRNIYILYKHAWLENPPALDTHAFCLYELGHLACLLWASKQLSFLPRPRGKIKRSNFRHTQHWALHALFSVLCTQDDSSLCLHIEGGIQKRQVFFPLCFFIYTYMVFKKENGIPRMASARNVHSSSLLQVVSCQAQDSFLLTPVAWEFPINDHARPFNMEHCIFFFWNFWVSALIAEFWPMTIYNRQFYSKVFQKCPCSSKCTYNDLLYPGSCWVFLPEPLWDRTSGLGCEAPLCLPSVFSCSELCQLGAVGDRWVWGTDLENISHLTAFLYFTGGEAEDNLEGSK